MDDERRYSDEEVEEIFRTAASPSARGRDLSVRNGLTLIELQAIGREVGVDPERIADAAARLDQRPQVLPRKHLLGMPISVGRSLDLPRPPTDREWSILVAELWEVFDAQGRERTSLAARSWNNGNLHVVIEPTEVGHRLRMGTRKGDAMATLGMGIFFVIMALVLLFDAGGDADEIVTSIAFALAGVATFTYGAVRLPRWASQRDEQMEHIAARALDLLSRPPAEASSPTLP